MSKNAVAVVVGRAVVEKRYRELLRKSPVDALDGYELTNEERQALAGLDHRHLEKTADALNQRLRMWFVRWAQER